jgi:hypothetical protein
MNVILARCHTFNSSGGYFSVTCVFHNDKHPVTHHTHPIRHVATSDCFDTARYKNNTQLSRMMNTKIQRLSYFYCVCLLLVVWEVQGDQKVSVHLMITI